MMAKAKPAAPAGSSEQTPATEKNETPRERFLRLAPPRTESALKKIKIIGNLAGPGYQWEPAEAQQMLDAIFDAVHDLKRKFEKAKAKRSGEKGGFKFKSGAVR